MSQRPVSASGFWTGVSGAVAAVLSAWLVRDWAQPVHVKTLTVLTLTAAVMIAIDFWGYRVYRHASREMSNRPVRPLDLVRVLQKLFGFWLTIAIIAALYALIPEYANALYAPFKDAALLLLPAVFVISPFYVAYVDRRQDDPVDAYAQLAFLVAGNRPADWDPLLTHARGWLVKAFFIPLMFSLVASGLAELWDRQPVSPFHFSAIYSRAYLTLFLFDVLLATIGYTLTLRLLDTHMRSVEPTLAGWVVCLISYRPLVNVQLPYIQYELDGLSWGSVFRAYPTLYATWGCMILFLVVIQVWSTAAFGLRFSNLTNRGIITSGPYRWVKHPAYLAKNLSWWMISMPFVAGAGWTVAVQSCLLLGAANLVYYFRAKTEERHLAADPVYRDYQQYIAAHGLLARLLGTVRLLFFR